ncbi:MAG TPA: thioredoxin domain-containing protein [Bryobacteraceae bacterium]|jgi:protein-disulfide isomerase|nr:thioredoxin domain-containing protein [Bryobacteraceae bacterium]
MENGELQSGVWVDDRLASLRPGGEWQPNAAGAFSRLRRRARVRRSGWVGGALAASLTCMVLLLALPTRGSCAQPFMGMVCLKPASAASGVKASAGSASVSAPAVNSANYKLSGSPQAPITLEIYTDYECPACAQFYVNTYPQLVANYVQTGKIRILHRDFPLPQHPFATIAARYANAAGEAGSYDAAVMQLFRTQGEWAQNGNVDAQLAKVLPPGVMQQVRSRIAGQRDAGIAVDQGAGYRDALNQTPTLIIVSKGKREKVAPIPSFNILKSYLDQLR